MDSEALSRLKKDPDFLVCLDYIRDCVKKLDTVSDIQNLSNEQAGEKSKARLEAVSIMNFILLKIGAIKKEKDINKIMRDTAVKYGL